MAGISSKAAGKLENRFKFGSQELDDDLGLNWYQYKYRNHDPQIGRFIEIDPLADEYSYNSTYAFGENKLGMGVELEGLEMVPLPLVADVAAKAAAEVIKKPNSGTSFSAGCT